LAAFTDAEEARLEWLITSAAGPGNGYFEVQATRPQTLAYALTDSPVGQLAWILEKFKEWARTAEVPEDAVDRDQLLTNVMLYWLTGTAESSADLNYENAPRRLLGVSSPARPRSGWRCSLPTTPSAATPSAPTISFTGPCSTTAATSPPWRPDLLVGDVRAFFCGVR
jgi:epoxide hydrolase